MTQTFTQQALNAGFSKVLGTASSQFILLDRDTDGSFGRRIYINGALAPKFAGMKPAAVDTAFEKIKQLRALAGGSGSYSNLSNAMEHMTVIGTVRLRYKIFQMTGETEHKPGVYITDVDVGSFGDGEPGLYRVTKEENQWKLIERPQSTIKTGFAAINGLCRNLNQAGTVILPTMLSKAYENKKWQGNVDSEGFTLFYNPPSLYHRGNLWRSPKQKRLNKHIAATNLAKALTDAQNRKQKVQWVVHSDGAHLLYDALKHTGGQDLSCHTMLFLAPTKDVSVILPMMRQSKIILHDDVMKIQADDWRSKSTQMLNGRRLQKELNQFPEFEDKASLFREQARTDVYSSINSIAGAFSAGLGAGAFVLAPMAPAPAAIAGMAWGAYATLNKIKSLRNMAANNSTNQGLNPHMHPFKTTAAMNLHAKKHSGGTLKTFKDVVLGTKKG